MAKCRVCNVETNGTYPLEGGIIIPCCFICYSGGQLKRFLESADCPTIHNYIYIYVNQDQNTGWFERNQHAKRWDDPKVTYRDFFTQKLGSARIYKTKGMAAQFTHTAFPGVDCNCKIVRVECEIKG